MSNPIDLVTFLDDENIQRDNLASFIEYVDDENDDRKPLMPVEEEVE